MIIAAIIAGAVGYTSVATFTGARLWRNPPDGDRANAVLMGIFWPLLVPFWLVIKPTLGLEKRLHERTQRKQLPEARVVK